MNNLNDCIKKLMVLFQIIIAYIVQFLHTHVSFYISLNNGDSCKQSNKTLFAVFNEFVIYFLATKINALLH